MNTPLCSIKLQTRYQHVLEFNATYFQCSGHSLHGYCLVNYMQIAALKKHEQKKMLSARQADLNPKP